MEAKQMREMSPNELAQKREDLNEEIFHLKLRLATSQLENPMKLGSPSPNVYPNVNINSIC